MPEGVQAGDRCVTRDLVDVHAELGEVSDQHRDVARVLIRPVEVAAHVDVRLLGQHVVQRADERVLLQLARGALIDRLLPLLDPAGEDVRLVVGGQVDRLVHREIVVVDLLAVVLVAALLVRHAGRAHDQRRDRVAVLGREEVVGVAVAVLTALVVEHLLQRRTDLVLDEVQREVRDLVQHRVLVGREEVPAVLLVGVDVEDARVLVHLAHEDAVLPLVARAEVAIGIERPRRDPDDVVAAVGVAHQHQEDVERVEPARVRTVGAGDQLVHLARDRLAGGGLVAMRGRGDPAEGRPVVHRGEAVRFADGCVPRTLKEESM